jgi:hypothetical protein
MEFPAETTRVGGGSWTFICGTSFTGFLAETTRVGGTVGSISVTADAAGRLVIAAVASRVESFFVVPLAAGWAGTTPVEPLSCSFSERALAGTMCSVGTTLVGSGEFAIGGGVVFVNRLIKPPAGLVAIASTGNAVGLEGDSFLRAATITMSNTVESFTIRPPATTTPSWYRANSRRARSTTCSRVIRCTFW